MPLPTSKKPLISRALRTTTNFAYFLLEKAHVATVAGSAFGAPGYLRLSFATSEDTLQEAARRIKEALWGDQR